MLRTIGNRLRNKLRAWLGVPDPPAPTIEKEAKEQGISIAQALLHRAGEKNIVTRKFGPPALPAGVVPSDYRYDAANDPGQLGPYVALDSEANAPAYAYGQLFNCGLGFPGYAYLAELSQRSEYRAPAETIAQEMTREFIKIIVKGEANDDETGADDAAPPSFADEVRERDPAEPAIDEDLQKKVEEITEAMECFKVRDHMRKLAELDGLFGRAQLFIDIDPGKLKASCPPDELRQLPLLIDPATVPKGSLCGFKVIEPIWTTPFAYNATDPTACDFYKPRAWFVLGKRIHASRLLTFVMREVPDMLKPSYNFGGLSMTQLMEPYVFQWLRTRNSVSDLVHNFSVMCLKTDMTNILSGEPDKPGGLLDRAKLFTSMRDNQGLTLLDMKREELAAVNVPLSGLDKLQAQAQEHQAAPSHIPLVKLLGVTPTGLNANSEGEIKVFYDFVRSCQQSFFAAPLDIIIKLIQLHLYGEIDDRIGFEFLQLSSPTVKELAEIRKANAETDKIYACDISAVSNDEVRSRLSSDPESGYNNLSGKAPPPPKMLDADLADESAQAAHERTLEVQANEPKPAARAA
jgi:phage-related protein (TIGR01555 family)